MLEHFLSENRLLYEKKVLIRVTATITLRLCVLLTVFLFRLKSGQNREMIILSIHGTTNSMAEVSARDMDKRIN
ncbi:hypothetical protein [Dysgonomonas sp.]